MAFIRLDTISSYVLQMGQVLGISLEDYALLPEKTGQFADRVKTGNLGQNQGPMQKIFFAATYPCKITWLNYYVTLQSTTQVSTNIVIQQFRQMLTFKAPQKADQNLAIITKPSSVKKFYNAGPRCCGTSDLSFPASTMRQRSEVRLTRSTPTLISLWWPRGSMSPSSCSGTSSAGRFKT